MFAIKVIIKHPCVATPICILQNSLSACLTFIIIDGEIPDMSKCYQTTIFNNEYFA